MTGDAGSIDGMEGGVLAPHINSSLVIQGRSRQNLAFRLVFPSEAAAGVEGIDVFIIATHMNRTIWTDRGGAQTSPTDFVFPFQGTVRIDGVEEATGGWTGRLGLPSTCVNSSIWTHKR